MLNDFVVPYRISWLLDQLTPRATARKKCSLHNDVYHDLPSLIKDVDPWKPLFILLTVIIYLHHNASQDTGLELNTQLEKRSLVEFTEKSLS